MIFTVTNGTELEAAFRKAEDGDRIELIGKHFEGIALRDRTFERPVTITSAEPGNPAVFVDSVVISGVTGITISDLHFAPDGEALDIIDVVRIDGSSDVKLQWNSLSAHIPDSSQGLPAHEDIDSAAKAKGLIEGQPFARGVRITGSSDVVIAGNAFTRLRKGIVLDRVERVDVRENRFEGLREDGINLVDAASVNIAGNLMRNFQPLHNYDNIAFADHGDFIQWWAGDGGIGIRDLVIRDNALLQGTGSWVQGIFGRGGSATPDGRPTEFSGIRIENNLINTSHPNGIFVGDAGDVLIARNTLLPAPMDLTQPVITSGIPGIHVRTSAKLLPDGSYDFSKRGALPTKVSLQDNVLVGKRPFESYRIGTDLHAVLNISDSGNTVLAASETSPGYWGNAFPHFVDRAIADLRDIEAVADLSGGIEVSNWPTTLRKMLMRQHPAVEQAPPISAVDVIRVEGTAGPDMIAGSDRGDVLRGGKGSDRITTGDGPDLIAFHRLDLGPGDLDTVMDLDFSAGDWLCFSGGFGRGFFDDGADPVNAMTTFGSGDSAIVHDVADLKELIAQDGVSARSRGANTIDLDFDLNGDTIVDWTLRLHGISGIGERQSSVSSDGLLQTASTNPIHFAAPDHGKFTTGATGSKYLSQQVLIAPDDWVAGF